MYYMYNTFTGRLIGASRNQAYAPQGIRVLETADIVNPYPPGWSPAKYSPAPAKIHSTQSPPQSAAAPSSSTSVRRTPGGQPYSPVSEKMKRLQEKFQKPDGVPVFLKGGPMDKVFYYITMGACVLGVTLVLTNFYSMAFPKKPQE